MQPFDSRLSRGGSTPTEAASLAGPIVGDAAMLDDAIRVLIAELRTKAVSLALRVPKSAILLRLVWQEDGHPFPGRL